MLTGRWERYVSTARTVAESSNCNPRKSMAALVIRGGKILAAAPNMKNHRGSIHAEANALARMTYQKRRPKGATVFVARFRQDGSFGNAKPCSNCIQFLKTHRVKDVVWTTANQTLEFCSLSELENDYLPHPTNESRQIKPQGLNGSKD